MFKNTKLFKKSPSLSLARFLSRSLGQRWTSAAFLTLLVSALLANSLLPVGVSNASPTPAPQAVTPPSGDLTTGDGTWFWQNNRPQGNVINSLSCPTDLICFAAGNSGTVLKSLDGGATWTSQNPNTTENLRGISCFDSNTCMTVGENSTIAVTTNGGISWLRRFFNGLNQTLYSVDCPTAIACYISGARVLLATADLGKNWKVTVQTTDLYSVSCPSGPFCFAVGSAGAIRFTGNAGTDWITQSSTPSTTADLQAVSCLNTLNCYAVGASGTLIKTTNGSTWAPVTGTGLSSTLYGISCTDTDNCTVVGGGGALSIFTTTNGGTSWQAQETYAPTMRAVACTSATTCFVGGDNGTLLSRKTALPAFTNNGSGIGNYSDVSCPTSNYCAAVAGVRFYSTNSNGVFWQGETTFNGYPIINKLSCIDANICSAVGNGGRVYYKTSGSDWHEGTPINSGTQPSLYGLDCKANGSQTVCYAVSGSGPTGRIFKSTDGGQTYTTVYSPASNSDTDVTLNAITCPALDNCYAVGANGVILKGGNTTWTKQYNSDGNNLSGVSCPTTTTCFATGENVGDIIGTTDGGLTWVLLNSPSSVEAADLNDIACPSATICQAVGNGGTLVTTLDGGKNWITQFRKPNGPAITQDLQAISCPTTALCVGVGDSVVSFYTTNGDKGWKGQALGPRWNLTAAACPNDTNCYAAGTGDLLYTKDRSTWTPLSAQPLSDISCPTASDCFAPYSNSKQGLITHDGGATWAVENNMSTSGITSLSCPASNLCFGVGPGGYLVKYDGNNWTNQSSGVNFDLRGISCPTTTLCYAVGYSSTFLYYSGGSWSQPSLGASYALNSISCPDTNYCYAVTNTGAIIHTTDHGQNWTSTQMAGFSSALLDINCPTFSDCVAVGANGAIFTTRNTLTWNTHASGTHNTLRGVQCSSPSNCVSVGDNGTLLVGSIIHSLNLTASTDNGQGNTFGSFSYALRYARPGQTIDFNASLQNTGIQLLGGLPPMPYGTTLAGICNLSPKYTIHGIGNSSLLELSGGNTINAVNFQQVGLKTTGTGNKIACTGVNRNAA